MSAINQWKNKTFKGSQFNQGIYDLTFSLFELQDLGLPFSMACFEIAPNEVIAIGSQRENQTPRDFIQENQTNIFTLDDSKPSRKIETMFGARMVHYAKQVIPSKGNFSVDQNLKLDFLFKSSEHTRYENGVCLIGPSKDANRAIKVEPNINGNEGYTVTIYNLDGNHPVWNNNIQMAPKQMKLIHLSQDKIVLQGYGYDAMGSSFADYGLTIAVENGFIKNCTMHMHDRNVDIVYNKTENIKLQRLPNLDKFDEVVESPKSVNNTLPKGNSQRDYKNELILGTIMLFIAVASFIFHSVTKNAQISKPPSYQTISHAHSSSSNNNTSKPIREEPTNVTYSTSQSENRHNNSEYTYRDDLNLTAEDAVKVFLIAFEKQNCDFAYEMCYNPTWRKKGKSWFCSVNAFGGITDIELLSISTIWQSYSEAEVLASYYAKDYYNGNKYFKQKNHPPESFSWRYKMENIQNGQFVNPRHNLSKANPSSVEIYRIRGKK